MPPLEAVLNYPYFYEMLNVFGDGGMVPIRDKYIEMVGKTFFIIVRILASFHNLILFTSIQLIKLSDSFSIGQFWSTNVGFIEYTRVFPNIRIKIKN